MNLEATLPGFESHPCHSHAVFLGAGYLVFLGLGFLLWKVGNIIVLLQRAAARMHSVHRKAEWEKFP